MTPREACNIVEDFASEHGSDKEYQAALLLIEQVSQYGELERRYWWRAERCRWEKE